MMLIALTVTGALVVSLLVAIAVSRRRATRWPRRQP